MPTCSFHRILIIKFIDRPAIFVLNIYQDVSFKKRYSINLFTCWKFMDKMALKIKGSFVDV